MWQYHRTDELYHHGVLGQRWGIRRYQNADGTLTPAGRRKAKKLATKYAEVTGKKLIVKKKSVDRNEPKSVKEMSDQELQRAINRIRLEQDYIRMTTPQVPKKQLSVGQKFVKSVGKNVIAPAATDAGRTLLSNWLKKLGNDYIYKNNQSGQNNSNNKNDNKKKEAQTYNVNIENFYNQNKNKSVKDFTNKKNKK